MARQNDYNKKGGFSYLLGEKTSAKVSGLTYSLSAVFSIVLAFIFLIILASIGKAEGAEEQDWYLYCTYLLSPVSFALVMLFVFRWAGLSFKTEAKAQRCSAKYFFIAIALQCGLLSLSQLNGVFLEWLSKFGYQDTPILLPSMDGFGFVGVLIVVALLPAVFEEIIFRGLLLKGMRSFGLVGAVLINGALFSLYHQNPAQTVYQFCCGVAFALMTIRAGSILPTVLSHFINNALILTLTKFGVTEYSPTVSIVVTAVSAVCLIGSLAWLIFADKNNAYADEKREDASADKKGFFIGASVGIALCALTWFSVLISGI